VRITVREAYDPDATPENSRPVEENDEVIGVKEKATWRGARLASIWDDARRRDGLAA
jgi:hypothetical protein